MCWLGGGVDPLSLDLLAELDDKGSDLFLLFSWLVLPGPHRTVASRSTELEVLLLARGFEQRASGWFSRAASHWSHGSW